MRTIVLVVTALLLSGCVTQTVTSTVTGFHQLPVNSMAGTKMVILAYPADRQNSLEFLAYRDRIASKFSQKGISVVDDPKHADWVAFLSYGIDGGAQVAETVTAPVYGQTGGGTTFHSGSIYGGRGGASSFSGYSYSMPTYGVVGASSSTVTRTIYRRNIAIDIVDRQSLETGSPRKLYEGRVVSSGSCSSLAAVFDRLNEALFQDWPGASGSTRTVDIDGNINC